MINNSSGKFPIAVYNSHETKKDEYIVFLSQSWYKIGQEREKGTASNAISSTKLFMALGSTADMVEKLPGANRMARIGAIA